MKGIQCGHSAADLLSGKNRTYQGYCGPSERYD